MAHRLPEAFATEDGLFVSPVEVDETYIGGKRRNMSDAERKELADSGRCAVGKTAVAGIRDRETNPIAARVVEHTDKPTLQGFIRDTVEPG